MLRATTLLLAATAVAAGQQVRHAALIGFDQSVSVTGTLTCHGKPEKDVKVKLYDDDSGPDPDDWMGEGLTDSLGSFSLSGWTDEVMTIDPKINIYHDCDDGLMPCQRRITIYVPKSYVSSGKTPTKTYNAGTIELSGQLEGEERDCFNRRR